MPKEDGRDEKNSKRYKPEESSATGTGSPPKQSDYPNREDYIKAYLKKYPYEYTSVDEIINSIPENKKTKLERDEATKVIWNPKSSHFSWIPRKNEEKNHLVDCYGNEKKYTNLIDAVVDYFRGRTWSYTHNRWNSEEPVVFTLKEFERLKAEKSPLLSQAKNLDYSEDALSAAHGLTLFKKTHIKPEGITESNQEKEEETTMELDCERTTTDDEMNNNTNPLGNNFRSKV